MTRWSSHECECICKFVRCCPHFPQFDEGVTHQCLIFSARSPKIDSIEIHSTISSVEFYYLSKWIGSYWRSIECHRKSFHGIDWSKGEIDLSKMIQAEIETGILNKMIDKNYTPESFAHLEFAWRIFIIKLNRQCGWEFYCLTNRYSDFSLQMSDFFKARNRFQFIGLTEGRSWSFGFIWMLLLQLIIWYKNVNKYFPFKFTQWTLSPIK